VIAATVVLNLRFFEQFGLSLWGSGPALLQLPLIAAASAVITSLFFVGPALALQAAKRPMPALVEDLIGFFPAALFRFCCLVALLFWVGSLLETPANMTRWVAAEQTSAFYFAVAVSLAVFLFLTMGRDLPTSGKLAMFSNQLAIAILAAAAIRVRDGWPAIAGGFPDHGQSSWTWHGLAAVSFFVGPIAFFAAGFATRVTSREAVISIGAFGLAIPFFFALAAVGLIGVATANSSLYRPSLNPTLGMALVSGVARSHFPAVAAVAAVTAFGALRLGIRALTDITGTRVLYPVAICAIAWIAIHDVERYAFAFDFSANVIAAMAAVLTANMVLRRRAASRAVNLVALIAGSVLPLSVRWGDPNLAYSHPGFLASYGIALAVSLLPGSPRRRVSGLIH
jgi:hypothetical protein